MKTKFKYLVVAYRDIEKSNACEVYAGFNELQHAQSYYETLKKSKMYAGRLMINTVNKYSI